MCVCEFCHVLWCVFRSFHVQLRTFVCVLVSSARPQTRGSQAQLPLCLSVCKQEREKRGHKGNTFHCWWLSTPIIQSLSLSLSHTQTCKTLTCFQETSKSVLICSSVCVHFCCYNCVCVGFSYTLFSCTPETLTHPCPYTAADKHKQKERQRWYLSLVSVVCVAHNKNRFHITLKQSHDNKHIHTYSVCGLWILCETCCISAPELRQSRHNSQETPPLQNPYAHVEESREFLPFLQATDVHIQTHMHMQIHTHILALCL